MSSRQVKPFSAILHNYGLQLSVGAGIVTQGQSWFVMPSTGNDGASGRRPSQAMKSLAGGGGAATGLLPKVTTSRNDVVYFLGEGNASAACTDYQSSTAATGALIWKYDMTHLIGQPIAQNFSPRSRVALLSTYNTAAPMVLWSANGCLCAFMSFFAGVAGTNPTGCLNVQGSRNHFFRCHIAGIGNAANDIAGAYSLYVGGADSEENLFEQCVIGLDTIDRGGNANSEILLDHGCDRTVFRDCIILSRIKHATNHPQVKIGSAAVLSDPSFVLFERCLFINTWTGYGGTQTYIQAGGSNITNGGQIIYKDCIATGIGTGFSAAGGRAYVLNTAINTAYTSGQAYNA